MEKSDLYKQSQSQVHNYAANSKVNKDNRVKDQKRVKTREKVESVPRTLWSSNVRISSAGESRAAFS